MEARTETRAFRKIKIKEITNGNVTAVETTRRTLNVFVADLEDYVKREGFEHQGEWYFRKPWIMNASSNRVFEAAGLMEKVGTVSSLKDEIPFPDEGFYTPNQAIYKLNLPNEE